MSSASPFNFKKETNRYKYYYQRLYIFYQKPVTQVSSAVLFTLAIIIFFAVFAIRPTLQTISELLRKIEDQKEVLTLAQKKSSALATAQQQLDIIQPSLPTLMAAIPDNYAAQEVLRSLEATAGNLNIPLSNLKIGNLEYPPPTSAKDPIRQFSFSISLEAPYPLTKQFIVALTQLPRLISIDNISVSTPEEVILDQNQQGSLITIIKCRIFYTQKQGNS